jgi:hypothetical protein
VVDQGGQSRLAMDVLADGRTAVFVYSALDRFADLYDPDHAWTVASEATLLEAAGQVPYDVLLVDTRRRTPAERESTADVAATPSATPSAAPTGPPDVFLAGSTPVAGDTRGAR